MHRQNRVMVAKPRVPGCAVAGTTAGKLDATVRSGPPASPVHQLPRRPPARPRAGTGEPGVHTTHGFRSAGAETEQGSRHVQWGRDRGTGSGRLHRGHVVTGAEGAAGRGHVTRGALGRGTGRCVRWLETHLREASPPLQPAEAREDLVPFVLHLPVDAHDLRALHQRLQGLSVVLHAGAGAAGGTEDVVAGHRPFRSERGRP